MRKFGRILLVILLGLGALTQAAEEAKKSPAILLQEAIYQEQTEGNLDKAIELYGQVLQQAAEVERLAARATYQLGQCYLKKGDQSAAADYFQRAVHDYPKQTSVVKKAKSQLDKITPNQGTLKYSFSPVFTQTINDDGVGKDFMFDLDNEKSYSASDAQKANEAIEKSLEDFVMQSGVDLFGETSKKCLMGINMIAVPARNERWNMSPEDVVEQVSLGKPGTPVALSADGELPKTFVFKTGQGGMGILQIVEMQDGKAPRHFKIQYKMLQKQSDGLYEQATQAVWSTIGSLYGQTCAKAGMKNLYTNSNIHFVNSDFVSWYGGYGYYTNMTAEPVSGRVKLGQTSFPNMKHYDIMGNPLSTEIVPVENEKGLYQIYLDLPQALAPGQFYPYAWAVNGSKKPPLVPFTKDKYLLKMENHLGMHGFEVFYLVVSNNFSVEHEEKSNTIQKEDGTFVKVVIDEPTKQTVGDFTIYAWEKEVKPNENHVVTVYLSKKGESGDYAKKLEQPVTVNASQSPDGDRLTIQYAAIEICKAAGVPYQWKKSQKLAGEKTRRYIEPIHFENTPANQILNSILEPLGLKYAIDENGIYLTETKNWVQGLVEDFFSKNYRDITSRNTLEWGEPTTDENGNISIRYKYEATIWDKEKIINDQVFKFDKDGKFISVKNIIDPSNEDSIRQLVEKFFKNNYRDITNRTTLEWGKPETDENGSISIRYKYEATIWDKDKKINDEIFTFDKDGKFVSVVDANPDPTRAENLVAEGWKLWGQRKLTEAEDKFQQAVRNDPKNDGAYQGLGWAQFNQGKKKNAEMSFKKCVKLNPENSAALNGLGWIEHGQGNIDIAIKWWEKAVKASNGVATASLSGLTQVYMDRKEYDKAIKYYEMWLKAEPDNQDAKDGLEKAKEAMK